MRKMMMCAVVTAALAVCLSAMAGSWRQPPDMTVDQFAWSSEKRPGDTNPPAVDWGVADDWKCTDGQPIIAVKWWGAYHPYRSDAAGPVDPPAFQPTGFILKQYSDNGGVPGALLNDVTMPIADCHQAYFGTAPVTGGFFNHIFSYEAILPAPWAQAKDSIYWVSVQAQFDRDPVFAEPPAGDGYLHWDWVSTSSGDFEGRGQWSDDGGTTWMPVEINPGDVINFAFEIGALPVGLAANKATFQQSDSISVVADVEQISTPCFPFVRIIQPDGSALYLEQNVGFLGSVTPYLGMKAGAIALPKIDDFPILQNVQFNNMPVGTYYLEGGAVDPVTTDISNLQYIGLVNRTPLVIQ